MHRVHGVNNNAYLHMVSPAVARHRLHRNFLLSQFLGSPESSFRESILNWSIVMKRMVSVSEIDPEIKTDVFEKNFHSTKF